MNTVPEESEQNFGEGIEDREADVMARGRAYRIDNSIDVMEDGAEERNGHDIPTASRTRPKKNIISNRS